MDTAKPQSTAPQGATNQKWPVQPRIRSGQSWPPAASLATVTAILIAHVGANLWRTRQHATGENTTRWQSDWTVPRMFFHTYQFQAEVAKPVKDAVQVGLIMDLADEDALFVAWLQGKPLECGGKASGEAPPDCDPVPGRLHVSPGVFWIGAHLGPEPDER